MYKLCTIAAVLATAPVSLVTANCAQKSTSTLDFIVLEGNAEDKVVEDNIRRGLKEVNIDVQTRFLNKSSFNAAMVSGDFNLCFSETWGPPYDPHSYAASWKSPDEAHYAAFKNLSSPFKTRAQLATEISAVLQESNEAIRRKKWKEILGDVHKNAVDLPFSGKRNPAVLNKRLTDFINGQQQFDYPMHTLKVQSGSKNVTVAPGAQTGLFSTVGRLDPHTYRPNEFFANNWVYEGLVAYGANGVIEPALATSWTVANTVGGGQEYTFTLRQGVKFHDGASWNCAAAKLNFDHVFAPPLTTSDWHGWYDLPKQAKSWKCTGTYTFVLETKGTYYPLLQELSYIRPLRMLSPTMFVNGLTTDPLTHNSCHKGWGNITGNGKTLSCAGTLGVAGTGAWSYLGTDGAGDAKFQRYADWWKSAPSSTSIEFLTAKKFSTHSAVKAALVLGSLDMVVGSGVLLPADIAEFRVNNTMSVYLGPVIQNRLIILNTNKAPTGSYELRKTIIHAVDKAAIIDGELKGLAEVADTLFPKNAPYCDVDLTPRWDYDIQKATLLNCAAPPPTPPAAAAVETGISNGAAATLFCVAGVAVVALMVTIGYAMKAKSSAKDEVFQELRAMNKDSMYARVTGAKVGM